MLPEAFFSSLFNSLIFTLVGATCVVGRRFFIAGLAAAVSAWRSSWKRYEFRLASTSPWPWPPSQGTSVRHCSPAVAARTSRRSSAGTVGLGGQNALVPAQEQLASEVALLLKRGRLLAAVGLLRSVRAARSALQPGPSCFRLVLQRLAHSSSPVGVLNCVMQEMCLHSLPLDALTQGCYVRCLCRGTHVDVEKAYQAYSAMLATGTPPDLRTLECLVEACLHLERHDLVKPLILALDDHGLEPSAQLYAALITSCAVTGAVACGMVAFEQMRPYMDADPALMELGYVSAIHMCAQNQQVDRALKLLGESRHCSRSKGAILRSTLAALDARVLPTLLAAAVQSGRTELALDLAHRARHATAVAGARQKDCAVGAHLDGLCKLLLKRQGSRALMTQVAAILYDSPSAEPTVGCNIATAPASKLEVSPHADKEHHSSLSCLPMLLGA